MTKIDLKEAERVSRQAHDGQKYGDKDYFYHINQVVDIVKETIDDNHCIRSKLTECIVIAYLHDTVEDTDLNILDIDKKFGSETAHNVLLVTDEEGKNRKERKRKTNEKLSKSWGYYYPGLLVKVADRVANARESKNNNSSLFKMYKKEHRDFKEATYREGLCDNLWKELDEYFGEECLA